MRPTHLTGAPRTTLFCFLGIVTTLVAVSSYADATSHGDRLESGYPNKFDYEGIVNFFIKNNLRFVHFGHLTDFVTAIEQLKNRHPEGDLKKFWDITQWSNKYVANKIYYNMDKIIRFSTVVRPSGQLCNSQHVVDLMIFYTYQMMTDEWMDIHFSNIFKQYISELGRLCRQRMGKVLALFEGQTHGNQRLSEEEQKNVVRVREAATLLCNFVQGSRANGFCVFNLPSLERFQVDKLEDLEYYMNRYADFYKSLTEQNVTSFDAITLDKDSWIVSAIQDSAAKSRDIASPEFDGQLPAQPLHAACELLENVYEQSTQMIDILGENEIFNKEDRARFVKDPLVRKWLNIERICSLIMRTTLNFDDGGKLYYPLIGVERAVKKPIRQLEPFSSYKEETIHQIDFSSTYKKAFTFGARLGTSFNLIGRITAEVTSDALKVLFSPLRLVTNSLLNALLPSTVDWVRAVKFGAAAQREYYLQAPMRGFGAALNDASQKLYELFDKNRFYV